ncbi:MAG: ribbon-helix-helix protein, CopG family [Betaproteobacteria bacterium]|nr:ribbon-helix-helix protein, CopG family [Betaproteobacteria bacterium]
MKMLTVRLDDQEAAALAALCEELGASRSEVVKRAIMDLARAARRKPFGQVARELGFVGCFSGPRDLGQNHQKYLRQAFRAKADR